LAEGRQSVQCKNLVHAEGDELLGEVDVLADAKRPNLLMSVMLEMADIGVTSSPSVTI
jgi:hypothetical protein